MAILSSTAIYGNLIVDGVVLVNGEELSTTSHKHQTLTRGSYLTGSNYDGSTATTWAVDATSANTASKVVARDSSGNFSAGTITINRTSFSGGNTSHILNDDAFRIKTEGSVTLQNGAGSKGVAFSSASNWFKPFDAVNKSLSLGTTSARWGTIYGVNGNLEGSLIVGGTSTPAITLALGDSDTGFKWISDGRFQMYANNVAVIDMNASSFKSYKDITIENGSTPTFTTKNTSGGDTAIVLDRNTGANWKMLNTGGNLIFQSDYTTSKGSYYSVLTLNYNTGDTVIAKGTLFVNKASGRIARFGNSASSPGSTIANQTSYIEIATPTNSSHNSKSGIVFHHQGTSTNVLEYVNTDQNNGYFNFRSDDTNYSVRINGKNIFDGIVGGSGLPAVTSVSDANTIWKSGFYESAGGNGTNFPSTNQWYWLIHAGHTSNRSDYKYGLQIAGKNTTDDIYYRNNPQAGNATWNSFITSKSFVGNATDTFIAYPKDGRYRTRTNGHTGYLKVTLPQSWTNTMMRFTVEFYNYSTNSSATYYICGYNYNSDPPTWNNNPSAYSISNRGSNLGNLTVRYGHDGTKCAIYIGESTTTWSYVQVTIKDITVAYSNYELEKWNAGWAIGFTTTLGTITSTISNPNVTSGLYQQQQYINIVSSATCTSTTAHTQLGHGCLASYSTLKILANTDNSGGENNEYVHIAAARGLSPTTSQGIVVYGTYANAFGSKIIVDSDTTNANTANKIVKRDGSGNFSAGTITATLSGNASSASRLASRGNVTAEGDTTAPGVSGLSMSQVYNNGYPTAYGNAITLHGAGSGQIVVGWSGSSTPTDGKSEGVWVRSKRDGSGNKWSSWDRVFTTAYPPSIYDRGNLFTIGSTGSANKNKYIRIARITLGTTSYANCSGTLDFYSCEGQRFNGTLYYGLRNGTDNTTTPDAVVYWESLSNMTYETCITLVKISNGVFELYYKGLSDWETTSFVFNINHGTNLIECYKGQSWVTAYPTGSSLLRTSSFGGKVKTLTRGTYLTGSNFDGSAATTWAVDATSANTASKVVARDSSGNFSAGTVTVTAVSTKTITGGGSVSNNYGSIDVSGAKGSWAGINFTSTTPKATLMVRASDGYTGMYRQAAVGSFAAATWIWSFNEAGVLAYGTVPRTKLTASANKLIYFDASGNAQEIGLGTSGQVLKSNGNAAPSWVNTDSLDIVELTKTITPTSTGWFDVGISGTNLATGSYVVQALLTGTQAVTAQYDEYYTGFMSWYSGGTNSTNEDEILLHAAGHARNSRYIALKVVRRASSSTIKLQVAFSALTTNDPVTIKFKFKKLI